VDAQIATLKIIPKHLVSNLVVIDYFRSLYGRT